MQFLMLDDRHFPDRFEEFLPGLPEVRLPGGKGILIAPGPEKNQFLKLTGGRGKIVEREHGGGATARIGIIDVDLEFSVRLADNEADVLGGRASAFVPVVGTAESVD